MTVTVESFNLICSQFSSFSLMLSFIGLSEPATIMIPLFTFRLSLSTLDIQAACFDLLKKDGLVDKDLTLKQCDRRVC